MALKSILTAPDPRLKKKSKPVASVDADVRQLMDDMLETMYAAPGIGLAAPQVGELSRVIVLDIDREGAQQEMACEGLLATCVQHEIDHLDGILFIDHISALKRNMILRKLLKARKEKERDEAEGKQPAAKSKDHAPAL